MDAVAWFDARRGIRKETLGAWGIAVEDGVIKFPYPGGATKYRKGLEKDDGDRKFWWDPPTQAGQVPFLPPDFAPRERMILVEGESDTLALWQNIPADLRDKVSVVGLSGVGSWKERYAEELFEDAKRVFVILDRDDPYENPNGAESVERGWGKIRAALGRKARRVILPQGINDVAEFFQRYDWAALQVLLKKANEPVRHYPRLDLDKPVPDTDWLVEDFLVSQEPTLLVGDGGVGKSFITMSLALAVAGGDEKFLGLPVKKHGRVLYVDEENSADLVLQRLNALGMEKRHKENLDYIWYAGVDLLNEPEKLLEEALDAEPVLLVVDSLSRVALGAEENSNTEMNMLLRKGIVPLARDTGAAVLVVHHTSKEGGKSRGASGIRNAADQEIAVVRAKDQDGHETGVLNIFPSKPRRKGSTLHARLTGDMEKDGFVRVERAKENAAF